MVRASVSVADESEVAAEKVSGTPPGAESGPPSLQAWAMSAEPAELLTCFVNSTLMVDRSRAVAERMAGLAWAGSDTSLPAEAAADGSESEPRTAPASRYRCGSAMASIRAAEASERANRTVSLPSMPSSSSAPVGVTCPAAFALPAPSRTWNFDGSVSAVHRPSENVTVSVRPVLPKTGASEESSTGPVPSGLRSGALTCPMP